jgi:hypothetical protein
LPIISLNTYIAKKLLLMLGAIITGDIVHSTRMTASQRNWLFKQISLALYQWDKDFRTKSETFRGDSFQCLVKNISDSLRIVLIQKTFIRSLNPSDELENNKLNSITKKKVIFPSWIFDARIAIGIGNMQLTSSRLASSGGEAFQLSGKLLDKMKGKKQTLAVATNDKFQQELELEFILLDAILAKTTALQCEVINLKLLGYTETEIAKRLNVKQSAVNQRSISGNWNAIESMIKRFEKIYSHE